MAHTASEGNSNKKLISWGLSRGHTKEARPEWPGFSRWRTAWYLTEALSPSMLTQIHAEVDWSSSPRSPFHVLHISTNIQKLRQALALLREANRTTTAHMASVTVESFGQHTVLMTYWPGFICWGCDSKWSPIILSGFLRVAIWQGQLWHPNNL